MTHRPFLRGAKKPNVTDSYCNDTLSKQYIRIKKDK